MLGTPQRLTVGAKRMWPHARHASSHGNSLPCMPLAVAPETAPSTPVYLYKPDEQNPTELS